MVRDEDMFAAFRICLIHKGSSPSAIKYLFGFEEDVLRLVDEVNQRTYHPSTSICFVVTNPKYREVFAAAFRDRVIHHYVAMRLEPLFEKLFTDRTFNCRKGKGVMYGVEQLRKDVYECSDGYTKNVWVVRFDLKGFFMSIDKALLDRMLQTFIEERYFGDDKEDIKWLSHVIMMHEPEKDCRKHSPDEMWDYLPPNKSLFTNGDGLGLPIGNLPSQHNANLLLHWLDMIMEKLGYKYHGRYVDDGYYMAVCETEEDKQKMLHDMDKIRRFLKIFLHVSLHPDKFSFQHYTKGVQFTGAVVKPNRVYVGNRTIHNAFKAVKRMNDARTKKQLTHDIQSLNSYLGVMRHYDTYNIRKNIVAAIAPEVWDKIYVKGHYESVHLREHQRKRPVPKEEWPQVYYMKDPINFELAGITQMFDEQDVTHFTTDEK